MYYHIMHITVTKKAKNKRNQCTQRKSGMPRDFSTKATVKCALFNGSIKWKIK